MMNTKLPEISDEDRQFLHYNPNTSDVVEWVQEYAKRAVKLEREECAVLVESRAEPRVEWGALHRAAGAIRMRPNV